MNQVYKLVQEGVVLYLVLRTSFVKKTFPSLAMPPFFILLFIQCSHLNLGSRIPVVSGDMYLLVPE